MKGGCAFPARSTPDHKSYRFKRVREMINNFTTHLKEETSEDIEHKVWCVTELTTNTQTIDVKTETVEKLHAAVDELEASMENLAMKVVKLFTQVSNQVTNDPFVKMKKLIQCLIWKLQWKFLRKADCDTELSTTNCPEASLREEVYNANFIHYEEKATNEDTIKDVQDAQSNLTQAIQILTDFYTKVIQNDFARLARVGDHSERVRSCTHFGRVHLGKAVNSGTSLSASVGSLRPRPTGIGGASGSVGSKHFLGPPPASGSLLFGRMHQRPPPLMERNLS